MNEEELKILKTTYIENWCEKHWDIMYFDRSDVIYYLEQCFDSYLEQCLDSCFQKGKLEEREKEFERLNIHKKKNRKKRSWNELTERERGFEDYIDKRLKQIKRGFKQLQKEINSQQDSSERSVDVKTQNSVPNLQPADKKEIGEEKQNE